MRLLALDQASNISGWAIFEDNKLIEYGKIDASNYDDVGTRLHLIRTSVQKIIIDYNIDKVVLEDIYLDNIHINNVKTFKVLSEVFGVIYELCVELNKPVVAVLAGTWKSTLGIKGKTRPEQKKNAQQYILDKYNLKIIQDIVDAICIGEHYIKTQASAW